MKPLLIGLLPLSALAIALPTGAESSISLPKTTLTGEIAQSDRAAIAQITNIRFQPGESGLDLILETRNGDDIRAFSEVDGNTLILDLVGVQLDIESSRYQADNPTDAVSSVIVETADAQTVRITIAGIETLPETNLAIAGEEFIVSLPGSVTNVEVPEPEEPVLANPAAATSDIAEITNVQLQPTASGAELILETSNGDVIQPFSTVEGETLILDLTNARLALPEGDRYSVNNPITEVSSLRVETLDSQSIRITMVGIEALPEVNLSVTGEEFIIDIPSAAAIAHSQDSLETSDAGTLRIGVTGQEENYVVEDATTATRTDTPLDQVPQSIQVIPKAVLDDQQVIRLNDALRNASGVVSNSRDQRGERFVIRGFDSSSILRDGFRLTDGASGNAGFQELANLERIEVLKGPAAILAGAVEPGGAINLISEQPLAEPFYELGFRAGNREFFEPSIDISGPLSADGSVLYRINALYRHENLDRDFDVPIERYFIAPTISWAANDRTDFTFNFEYSDESRPSDFGGLPAIGDRIARVPFDRITGEPGDDADNTYLRVGYLLEHRFSEEWKIRNTFRHIRFENSFVSNVTFGVNEVSGDLFRVWVQNAQPSSSYELQTNVVGEFTTGAIEHTLLAGIDLFRRDGDQFRRFDLTPQPTFNIFDPVYGQTSRPDSFNDPLPQTGSSRTDNLGVYIQDQISFSDDFFALVGVRYDTVTQETADLEDNTSDSQSSDAVTPRIGFVYKPIDELSLYASYSTSFSPNSGTDIAGELLEPERGQQFEVGTRAELLDGRLSANLAFFNITKQNVATLDPDSPPGEFFFTTTGEQRSQGIEFDLIGEILPGWNIAANYAYTDADITEDDTGLEGNRLFGAPEHNANFWTSYEIQEGDLAGLQLGVGLNYVSDRFGDNDNSYVLEGYFLTNAAISYRRDNWRVGLNFRNLFDVDYIDSSEGSREIENRPGDGFTILGNITVEF